MSQENPLLKLVGPSLLKHVGTKVSTEDALKGKELVLLYFSASWCPPCKAFSPLLSRFYENCAKEGKLEIIYVSSDRTVESFAEYYGKMPWLAIPSDAGCAEIKNNLAQLFQIAGIPSTIVLNAKTGHYITDNARNAVTEIAHGPKEKGMELIETWNGMESVPLEEAAQKRQRDMPAQNPILAIIMAILRNPMYLIGLMYLYKYVKRTYFSQTIEDDSAESALAGAAAEDLTEDASPADSEF